MFDLQNFGGGRIILAFVVSDVMSMWDYRQRYSNPLM